MSVEQSDNGVSSQRYLLILNSQGMVWLKREGKTWKLPMGLVNRTDIPCITPVIGFYIDACSEATVCYACQIKGKGNGEGWFSPKNLPQEMDMNSRFFVNDLHLR